MKNSRRHSAEKEKLLHEDQQIAQTTLLSVKRWTATNDLTMHSRDVLPEKVVGVPMVVKQKPL